MPDVAGQLVGGGRTKPDRPPWNGRRVHWHRGGESPGRGHRRGMRRRRPRPVRQHHLRAALRPAGARGVGDFGRHRGRAPCTRDGLCHRDPGRIRHIQLEPVPHGRAECALPFRGSSSHSLERSLPLGPYRPCARLPERFLCRRARNGQNPPGGCTGSRSKNSRPAASSGGGGPGLSSVGVFFTSRLPDPSGPRRDHLEFCRITGAELVALVPRLPAVLTRLRLRHPLTTLWMAWPIFRARHAYDVLVTDSEHVGLPLGIMLRLSRSRSRHVLVVHAVSTPLKGFLIRHLVGEGVSCYVFHSQPTEPVLDRLGVPPGRRRLVPYMVDSTFWFPTNIEPKRQICAVGQENRDYPTLIEAVRGLDVRVEIAAGSPWSETGDRTRGAKLPANVNVCRRDYRELRHLYAESMFTVVPLVENDMQAGITSVVETMAMA